MNLNNNNRFNKIFLSKNYFFILMVNLVSSLGDYVYDIGVIIYLFNKTNSTLVVGGFFVFQFIPSLLMTPFVGVFIDKYSKKNILIFINILRGFSLLILIINNSILMIYIIAVILGITDEIFSATSNSITPLIVKEKYLVKANSMTSSMHSFTMIIGPLVASILMNTIQINGIILLNSVTFFLTVIFLFMLKIDKKAQSKIHRELKEKSMINNIKDGYKHIKNSKIIVRIFIIWNLLLAGIGTTSTLMIAFLSNDINSPNSLGYVMTSEGIGIGLGSFIIIKFLNNYHYSKLIQIGMIAIGGTFLIVAFSKSIIIVLVLYLITGLGAAFAPTGLRSAVQKEVNKNYIGRVFMSIRFITSSCRTIAIIIASTLVGIVGVRYLFIVAGIFIISGSLVSFTLSNDENKVLQVEKS